jgi:PAS domain S-box-containing protein/putative nucleotidyltransferase with HDIG domain
MVLQPIRKDPMTLGKFLEDGGGQAASLTTPMNKTKTANRHHDRFRALFNAAADAIFIYDTTLGIFTDVNEAACAMFGYVRRDLLGRDIASLSTGVTPYTQEAALLWLEKARTAPQLFEWYCKKKDGHLFWAEASLRGMLFEGSNNGLASLRDITARKESEKALRRSIEATIQVIANTVDMRDPYTSGHQQRVTKLAVAIAKEMRLPEVQLDAIKFAAIIHDLGKVCVPSEILSKPGRLSPAEFALLKEHAQAGYNILKDIDFPWPIAQIVRQHHERIDGSGYPDGLKGEHILVEAKVIATADVVEAMTAHRPYRAALGIDAALAEIEQGKGHIYDGAAVDACLKLFRTGNFKFN